MTIKIKQLTIKNFLSVGAVTQAMKLDESGLTLVLGSNSDTNGGITRNGAGKSTILQAISFGLFGSPLTSIKKDNLINNINGKGMLVTIDFDRDGKSYRIERGRKPNVMKFYVNDQEQKLESDETQGENKHTQEEIERLLGMTHTMFKHIVALNTFTDPFLRMKAADQRAVIEELLGITQISQRAEVLKKLISQTKEQMRDQEAAIKATVEANDRISGAIRQAEAKHAAWETAHENRIATLAAELEETMSIDFEAEVALFDALDAYIAKEGEVRNSLDMAKREYTMLEREVTVLEGELARLRKEIDGAAVAAQIKRLESDRAYRLSEVSRANDRMKPAEEKLAQAEVDLAGADASSCVCCGQKLEGTDHLQTVIASLQETIEATNRYLEHERGYRDTNIETAQKIAEEIAAAKEAAEARKVEIGLLIEDKKAELDAKADAVIVQANAVDEALKAVTALGPKPRVNFRSRDEVYRVRQVRDNLERDLQNEVAAVNPHVQQIDDLKATLQPVSYETLNDLTSLFKHQDFLLKLLTGKDSFIRKRIIDQNLSYLNSRLNHYLEKLGLPHEVTFQSDLSVDITNLGRDFDFEQLSRGEMNRVIMATSWSFRDVWESMNTSCNLLWVDELLDQGTDGQGVEAALSILKGMARDRGKNVFLISHRDELQARIDRTMLVRKENGFTTLEPDSGS